MKIEDYRLYSLGHPITDEQRDLFSINIKYLMDKKETKNCLIFYRGENKTEMFKQYNSSDFTSFGHILFLIGNKGKGFLKILSTQADKIDKWRVDDISINVYEKIFNILRSIYSDHDLSSNPDKFVSYFKDEKKLFDFKTKISKLNKVNKIKFRDYYLTLIHQSKKDEVFYPVSTMLSVSIDKNVAARYAGKEKEKIILVGWIPKKRISNKFSIRFDYLNSIEKSNIGIELPLWNKSFYPEDHEITLKGGILPHYLIGYIFEDFDGTETLDINPSLIDSKLNSNHWFENGLPIDQAEFWNVLKETNHSGGFFVNLNGEYWSKNR
ncbi:MAG: hypothetical protein WC581_11080 [Thermodesulfovibrionales bacterium]